MKRVMFSAPFAGRLVAVLTALIAITPSLHGQSDILSQEGYITPPAEIAALVDAPRHESVILSDLSPDGRYFLNMVSSGLPSLADFARDYYRLGGLALDPAANRSRNLTTRGSSGLEIVDARTGSRRAIQIPDGATVSQGRWAPDGSRVAFLVNLPGETHIFTAEASGGRAQQLTRTPVLATRVTSFEWSGDGSAIYAVVLPEGRGAEPVRPAAPTTPIIRVAAPEENRLRTYPSLLKDPHDQALLEYFTTGQLVRIEVSSRRIQTVGSPAMIESIEVAPAGDHVRVRTTRRPFSYIVPVSQFGNRDEIWDMQGDALVMLNEQEAREGVDTPPDASDPPRRALSWRPDGAGLSFLQREAAPERDEDAEPEEESEEEREGNSRKDRVMQWLPPFDESSLHVVYESDSEIRSVEYSADARWLFITRRQRDTERVVAIHLDDPTTEYALTEWDTEDFHANPGSLLSAPNAVGISSIRLSPDGESVFLSGTRYFENPDEVAPRAFVDRVQIRTGESERLWEGAADQFERVSAILDEELNELVLTREGPRTVPDSWHLNRSTGELRNLTGNRDPHPVLTQARRERFTVTRADGIQFKVDVTFPPDYEEGTRLPAFFWFYPSEFDGQESYDRSWRNYNRNRFITAGPRSLEILAAWGYLVVQPDFPIVGEEDRINDNFVVDIRQNHLAVIDALDERGWIDRKRLALGGHSYGGFGTINTLVQTPYFRAGIAGAPNTNRLLTPIGFQRESRPLWQARETYLEMSPFLWAERLQGALLIYHGEDDQNVGTFPDNSWRMIHALNGLGKTAALYMYPFEDHGPATRETLLDMWARWIGWLDHYVKNPEDGPAQEPVAEDSDHN